MKRALLTGGTGFVGACLARRLLRDGHRVTLLVRQNHQAWRLRGIERDVELVIVSLDDADAMRGAVASVKPEWVFHLAAYGAYSWQGDVREMHRTNIGATINLLEAAKAAGFSAFVNTGSSSEYGFKDHAPAEDECTDSNSHYSWTKGAATNYLRHVARSENLHAVTLRLYSIFGPWEDANRLMPKLVLRGMEGKYPPLANPDVARDYVYAEDACDAMILAAEKTDAPRGSVYNLGSGVQTPLRQAAETARDFFGIAEHPSFGGMENRAWDTTVWVADRSRITKELGWTPRHTFAEGFAAMAEWFRGEPGIAALYKKMESELKRGAA